MRNELQLRSYLDTEEPNESVLRVALMIDGEAFVDPQQYAIDLQALVSSQYSPKEYYIITCTCGDAGCAGIWKGIQVLHDAVSVHWVVHSFHPTTAFRFEHEAYQKAIERGLKAIRGWFAKYPDLLADYQLRGLIRYFPDLAPVPQLPQPAKSKRKKRW